MKKFFTGSVSSFLVRRFSSYTYLNITQFLGSLNDNIYKLLIVYFCIEIEGIENSPTILSITGAIFVLPFLLFSTTCGTLADRFSKRNIIAITKVLELFTMIAGIFAFAYGSVYGSYIILFLLATQSALFSPSKYGIIPELVPTEEISKANGIMTSFSFLGMIFGTFFASFLLDISGRSYFTASLFCTFIAFIGVLTSFCIEYTLPSGSNKRLNTRVLYEVINTFKMAREDSALIASMCASAFFFFVAAFTQLNMIPYAVQSLNLSDTYGGYLFLLTALGIGTGSYVAGRLSGKTVELGIVPLAGIGISFCFYQLDFLAHHLFAVIPFIMLIGFFGGIYMVPTDSYCQIASPQQQRGEVIAATNFLSFVGVLVASILLYLIAEVFGFGPDKGFAVMGSVTLAQMIIITFIYFDYVTRFLAMILSRLHFKISFIGQENIPESPAIYICAHTAWNDMLLVSGAQRRRIRFYIETEKNHGAWMKRLYALLRGVRITGIDPLEKNQRILSDMKVWLDRGFSICIFVENPDIADQIKKLMNSYYYQETLNHPQYPTIPIFIQKEHKEKPVKFFKKLVNKFRIPAIVAFGEAI